MLHLAEFDNMDLVMSAIGNEHGDIYESLHEFSINSRLNRNPTPSYYEKYMKPVIQGNGDMGKFKL